MESTGTAQLNADASVFRESVGDLELRAPAPSRKSSASTAGRLATAPRNSLTSSTRSVYRDFVAMAGKRNLVDFSKLRAPDSYAQNSFKSKKLKKVMYSHQDKAIPRSLTDMNYKAMGKQGKKAKVCACMCFLYIDTST